MSKHTPSPLAANSSKTTPLDRLGNLLACAANLTDMIGLVSFLDNALIYNRASVTLGPDDINGLRRIMDLLTNELRDIAINLDTEIDLQKAIAAA